MLSNYLSTKTIEFSTSKGGLEISYEPGVDGQSTLNVLIDPQGVECSMLDLVHMLGGQWLADQIKEKFSGGIVESFSDALGRALESIAFDDQGIAIGRLASLSCTAVNVRYEKRGEASSRISIEFLTEDLSREHMFLDIHEENDALSKVTFSGQLALFGLKTNLVALYDLTEDWEVQLKTLPGEVINLSRLISKVLEKISLPAELPDFSLTDVSMAWHPKSKGAYLSTSITHDWTIELPGNSGGAFSIKDNALQVTMAGGSFHKVGLVGLLVFGNTGVTIKAAYEVGDGWGFLAQTQSGQLISLKSFIESIPVAALPDVIDPKRLSVMGLSDLIFYYNTGTKDYRFQFVLSNISIGKFKVEQLHLDIDPERKKLDGDITLMDGTEGEINIHISAVKITTDMSFGSRFEGSTGTNQEIPIGTLISDLAEKFGITATVPQAIDSLTLKNLDISYDTGTKDFSFLGRADFEINSTTVEAVLQVIISHRPNGSAQKTITGQITFGEVDPQTFQLHFDQSEDSTLVLAAYHSLAGHRVSIADLIGNMASLEIPDVLSFTLHEAILAYDADQNSKKALFAAHIGGGIDLSNLPLAGKLIPQDGGMTFNYQLVFVSQSMEATEVADINRLLPTTMSELEEAPLKKGLAIPATLKMADEILHLELPVSVNSNSEAISSIQDVSDADSEMQVEESTAVSPIKVNSEDDPIKWIAVSKTFGPVNVKRIGVQFKGNKLYCLLDTSMSLGPLNISLDGLSVASPLSTFKPEFNLFGLGLSYAKESVEISGAFLRDVQSNSYSGTATIKTPQLNIAALGAYQELNGEPSLFIYALLDKAVGVGPPFMQVTGISAGFGFNRTIKVPDLAKIKNFPLVSAVVNKKNGQETDPARLLQSVKEYIPAATGELFMAFGIKFNSFKMLDSFALLLLRLGSKTKLDILGVSKLRIPSQAPRPLAEVELVIKASYDFEEKNLKVRGELTKGSYVLSRQCRLSGGFAFFSWFEGRHAGDVVFTMGGYHPDFKIPSHYPKVPRLGFHWQLAPQLSVKGSMYYAMVPGALMVGGRMEAVFEYEKSVSFDLEVLGVELAGVKLYGKIKAWLIIGADFLIAWEPYHYDARLYLNVGISVTFRGEVYVNLIVTTVRKSVQKSFSISLGANLHIWGPEFAGIAHVDWSIVSFDIAFGNRNKPKLEPLSWGKFKSAFLPENTAICTVTIADGLIKQDMNEVMIVNPTELELTTNSIIPATETNVRDQKGGAYKGIFFGIGCMKIDKVNSSYHHITITDEKGNDVTNDFMFEPILQSVPSALWGSKLSPGLNDEQLLINMLTGFSITPAPKKNPNQTEEKSVRDFAYDVELRNNAFDWEEPLVLVAGTENDEAARKILAEGIKNETRNTLLETLGLDTTEIDLSELSRDIDDAFLVIPQIVNHRS